MRTKTNFLLATFALAGLTAHTLSAAPAAATFSATSTASAQPSPRHLVVTDFDLDGAPDVAVTTSGPVVSFKGQLSLGQPSGALGSAQASIFNGGTPSPCTSATSISLGYHVGNPQYLRQPVLHGATPNAGYVYHINPVSGFPSATASCDFANTNSTSGLAPLWITTADFDGNGYTDSVGLRNDGKIYLATGSAFGTGLPTFGTPIALPGGLTGGTTAATGDLNSDGRPDIVITAGASIAVFLAQKQPPYTSPYSIITTGAALSLGAASSAQRAIIADATGDNKADIIVTTASEVIVFPGSGAGTFGSPVSFAFPASFTGKSTAVADLNGDDLPDLAVAATGAAPASNAALLIFYGSGTPGAAPSFAAATITTIGPNSAANLSPADVVAADMNLDGRPDLIVSALSDNSVWVMLNTTPRLVTSIAQGVRFQAVTSGIVSSSTVQIATSDGAAVPSLTVAPAPNSSPLSWVSLSATGNQITISPTVILAPGPGTYSGVAAVSASGYGRVLIPYTVVIARPSPLLRRGGATGTLATGLAGGLGSSGPTTQQMAIGDFNSDGIPDIAGPLGYTCPPTISSQYCGAVFTRKADGTGYNYANNTQTININNEALAAVATADVNRDGKLDAIFVGSSTKLTVGYGDGSGGFTHSIFYQVLEGANAAATGDLNGDAWPDIVVSSATPNTTPGITVLLSDGSGGFNEYYMATGKRCYSIVLADFNADGRPDIAARRQTSSSDWGLDLFLGLSGGRFGAAQSVSFPISGCAGTAAQCTRPVYQTDTIPSLSLTTADFNGDGIPDLAFTDLPASGQPLKPAIVVALANVDAARNVTFSVGTEYAPAELAFLLPYHVAAADIDGDGKVDLGFEKTGTQGKVAVLPGNGNGTFASEVVYGNFTNDQIAYSFIGTTVGIQFADLDGDGRTDMIAPPVTGDFSGTAVGIAMGVNGPPVRLHMPTFDGNVTAGVSFSLQLQAQDVNGNPATGYTGTVHFTSTDNTATLPANYTFTAADNSTRTFQFTLRKAGIRQITVTDVSNAALTRTISVQVVAGAPFVITLNSPASAAVNTAFSALTAHVTDAFNNLALGAPVTFAATPGTNGANGALANGGSATTDSSGDASIIVTANTKAGTFTVTASAGSASSSPRAFTITAGAPAILNPSGTPQNVPLGGNPATPLSVTVTDTYGNPLSGQTVTFAVPPVGGVFSGCGPCLATTNASGVATPPAYTASLTPGAYNMTVSLGALSATYSLTNTFIPGLTQVLPADAKVSYSAFQFSLITGKYSGLMTVKNQSAVPITGPVYVGFTSLPVAGFITNPTGTYGAVAYIKVAPAGLAPGQSVTVTVQLINPNNQPISLGTVLYH